MVLTALAAARQDLRADCSRCAALCCVVPAFARSADFALDKPAGTPCPHLQQDLRCGIHERLRGAGFPGCDVFDCFGAGQRVTAVFGAAWREETGAPVADLPAAFSAARQLSEAMWHLVEARERTPEGALHEEVRRTTAEVAALLEAPGALAEVDAAAVRAAVGRVLRRVSAAVRADGGRDLAERSLAGARLRGADLRDADLRGALLLGADLRGARLQRADLLGADLRAADLRGADLTDALFLTVPALTAAVGDATTVLPDWLTAPGAWAR